MSLAAYNATREMTTHTPNTAKKLLGTWHSDRSRTLEDWIWRRGWPARKRKRLASIFGHLTLRYTKSRLYSDYKGHKEIQKYKIVAGMPTPSPSHFGIRYLRSGGFDTYILRMIVTGLRSVVSVSGSRESRNV